MHHEATQICGIFVLKVNYIIKAIYNMYTVAAGLRNIEFDSIYRYC